jgi:hypothetical protein
MARYLLKEKEGMVYPIPTAYFFVAPTAGVGIHPPYGKSTEPNSIFHSQWYIYKKLRFKRILS